MAGLQDGRVRTSLPPVSQYGGSKPKVVNKTWTHGISKVDRTHRISVRIHDSNEIPKDSIPRSQSVLPEPGNMAVAVGISLLSCIRAEINVISYPLPVSGRHLCFTTYPNFKQPHYFYCVFYGTENVLFSLKWCCCILADIHVGLNTIFQPPSYISAFRFHLGVLSTAPLKSLTPKTWG